jgi:hypothetical protein
MLSFRRFPMVVTAVRRLGLFIATPLLFLGTVGLPQPAAAQNIYAAVHGTVTDTSGAAIPGAAVSITNTSTGITTTATTDSHGYYILTPSPSPPAAFRSSPRPDSR